LALEFSREFARFLEPTDAPIPTAVIRGQHFRCVGAEGALNETPLCPFTVRSIDRQASIFLLGLQSVSLKTLFFSFRSHPLAVLSKRTLIWLQATQGHPPAEGFHTLFPVFFSDRAQAPRKRPYVGQYGGVCIPLLRGFDPTSTLHEV